LATIGRSGTNPDLTDPKLAAVYRTSSKVTYFRTVTTDAYQAPGMVNFLAEELNISTAFVLTGSSGRFCGNTKSLRT
jgi:branched-chain amino acid transport system substrate-binding protein